jgi:hypothetical protein
MADARRLGLSPIPSFDPHYFAEGGIDETCAVCFPPELADPPGAEHCDHNDAVAYAWRPWRGFTIARVCISCGHVACQPGHWWSRRNMTEAAHALQRVLAAEQAERIAAIYARR